MRSETRPGPVPFRGLSAIWMALRVLQAKLFAVALAAAALGSQPAPKIPRAGQLDRVRDAAGDCEPLHTPFRSNQLAAALAFLRAHPGQVSPITVTLGGNDLNDVADACKGNLA